jgi:LysM repeat protein
MTVERGGRVAEGEAGAANDALPVDLGHGLFRPGPQRDPADLRSACRFLERETPGGAFEPAVGSDPANRCVALGEPVPQSSQQQELVCLVGAHVNCPRYLRGLLVSGTPVPPPSREPVSRAVIGATLVLTAAIATSVGFLAVRGGFDLPRSSSTPDSVAAASPVPVASVVVVPSAPPSPSATPAPTPSPAPSAPPSPTPTPTPTPARTPTPTPTVRPAPSSDRYAVLTKCPSQSDCWIYVIRAGDNLHSIANWFGVSYSRMLAMNPNLRTPIHAGDALKIPTPTR